MVTALHKNTPLHHVVDDIEDQLEASQLFFGHSTHNAWEEAAWMGLYATQQGMDQNEFDWDIKPNNQQLAVLQGLLHERIETKRPLAYLIQEAWFCGHKFFVDERVIVPRSYFGEWIPQQFSPWINADNVQKAVDLCTGCGCIAIALAYAFPQATVDATELSAEALQVAKINVDTHQLQHRINLHQGDLFANIDGQYDLICTNPPYIDDQRMHDLPKEYLHEPEMAFRGGQSGLDLVDRIIGQAAQYLTDKGVLIVEVGTSALTLEKAYPQLAFTWLATQDEAMAIFLLEKRQLPV